MESKFNLGIVFVTGSAQDVLHSRDLEDAITRHSSGDWGEVGDELRLKNERALKHGHRLFSIYIDRYRTRFWIITEAGRSATTILLPRDY